MLRLLAALATFLVAAAAEGCARSSAEPAGRRAPEAPATAVAARPPILDQGEEITPEELETIPEPVPASPGGAGGSTPRTAAKAAQEAPQTGSGATGPAPAAGTARWSVQVLATQDRDLADRTANEVSRLLGVRARVEHEGSNYKVRLGDYGSEDQARSLRDQAVRSGYPGAFRIRCAPTTLNKG